MDSIKIYEAVRDKALADKDFRDGLLTDAREAIFQATGEVIPKEIKVTVHESGNTNLCFVLPYKQRSSASVELSDDEMDQVAGGDKVYTRVIEHGHFEDDDFVTDWTETFDHDICIQR